MSKSRKCEICKDEQASWAWMPFGPAETPNSYALLGSHYRGFPAIKVGDLCKSAFQTGDFEVRFEYKSIHFLGKDHEVKEILSTVDLWDGGASSYEHARGDAQMVMRTTTDVPELVAMVSDAELLNLFIAAPQLLEACEEVDSLRGKIEFHLESARDRGQVADDTLRAVLMALAKVKLALKAAKGEEE